MKRLIVTVERSLIIIYVYILYGICYIVYTCMYICGRVFVDIVYNIYLYKKYTIYVRVHNIQYIFVYVIHNIYIFTYTYAYI